MTAEAPATAPPNIPFHTIVAFALPGLALAGVILVFGVYLPRYYVGLGVDFLGVGLAVAVVRLIDVWFDPLLALGIDRTRTSLGRYRVWVLAGAPALMLGLYMLLMPKGQVTVGYMILWLLVSYVGLSAITLSTTAWTSALAPTYHGRSRVYGWTLGIAVLGSIALLLLPAFSHGAITLGKAASMPAIAVILIVAVPIAVAICAVATPEPMAATERPRFRLGDVWAAMSRPSMARIILADLFLSLGVGVTAPLYVYFFHDAKGFNVAEVGFLLIFYIGASLLGAPFWARLAQGIGKHRTLQIACVFYAIAQTTLMALPRVWPGHTLVATLPTVAGMFAVGFTASAFILLIRAMVADVVDEARLESGQDNTSLLFSMVTTTSKIGGAITVTAVFPILSLVGYNGKEGSANTAHAIFGLEMCYLFAPIILVFLGGGLFFGYRLDAARHAEIRAALAAREAASAEMPLAEAETSLVTSVN